MIGFLVAGGLGFAVLAALVTILIGAIPNTIALWFVARTELGENAEKVTILNCFICVMLLGLSTILWFVMVVLIAIYDVPLGPWLIWLSIGGLFVTWKAIVEGMFEIIEGAYTILVIYFVVTFMVKSYVQPALFEMIGWGDNNSRYEEEWDDDWDDEELEISDAEREELEKLGEIAPTPSPPPMTPDNLGAQIMARAVANVIEEQMAAAQAGSGSPTLLTEPTTLLPGHTRIAYSAGYTDDGNAVSTGEDGTLRHWVLNANPPRAGKVARFDEGGGSRTVDVTPDGNWAITGDVQGRVIIWDMNAMTRVKSISAGQQHQGEVLSVAIHPRGRWAISGGVDKRALFWNLEKGEVIPFTQHTDMVTAVDLMPDGYLALTGSLDGTLRLIDFHTPNAIVVSGLGRVMTVKAAPDRRHALVGNTRGQLFWVDLGHGRIVAEWTGHPEKDIVSVAIDPAGRFVVSGGADYLSRIWSLQGNAASGAIANSPALLMTMQHPAIVRSVAVRPDGGAVLTACDDGRLRLWSLTQ